MRRITKKYKIRLYKIYNYIKYKIRQILSFIPFSREKSNLKIHRLQNFLFIYIYKKKINNK